MSKTISAWAVSVIVLSTVPALCGCGRPAPQEVRQQAPQETSLGPLDTSRINGIFSKDGRHFAYVNLRGNGQVVVVDGQRGPEYDGISMRTPVFSPDGKRVAYEARKGAKWLLVVDGQPDPEYDGIFSIFRGTPVFSPDGQRVAYAAIKGVKCLVVVDGEPGPEYDDISAPSVSWSWRASPARNTTTYAIPSSAPIASVWRT
jgi:hypothetical protein